MLVGAWEIGDCSLQPAASTAAKSATEGEIARRRIERPSKCDGGRGRVPAVLQQLRFRWCYSPYGTQMFFTCDAARRNSRPSPSARSIQSRSCHVAQVRFMFDAEASSTVYTPSRPPKYL